MNYLIIMIIFVTFSLLKARARGENTGCLVELINILIYALGIGIFAGVALLSNGNKLIMVILCLLIGIICIILSKRLDDK